MPSMTKRDQQIIDHYTTWDPQDDERSADDIANELGVSRQRLYQVLKKHDVPLKTGRPAAPIADPVVAEVGRAVLEQLFEARAELSQYRAKYGPLD